MKLVKEFKHLEFGRHTLNSHKKLSNIIKNERNNTIYLLTIENN